MAVPRAPPVSPNTAVTPRPIICLATLSNRGPGDQCIRGRIRNRFSGLALEVPFAAVKGITVHSTKRELDHGAKSQQKGRLG